MGGGGGGFEKINCRMGGGGTPPTMRNPEHTTKTI